MAREKNPKRVAAGRKGGQRNIELHGADRMRELGRQGGAKGGRTTLERHGTEHFRRMGRLRWAGKRDSR